MNHESPEYQSKVNNWLTGRSSFPSSLLSSFYAKYYLVQRGGISVSEVLLFVMKAALAASGPTVFALLREESAFAGPLIASAVLFSGYLFVEFIVSKRKKINIEDDLAAKLVNRFAELLTSITELKTHKHQRETAIESALGIIEKFAQFLTSTENNEISVSIVLYTNKDRNQMVVRYRNRGNLRRKNVPFTTAHVLGHHAIKSGGDKIPKVNDLRDFGKEGYVSPTGGSTNYRSILFVPLFGVEHAEPFGFLSIDCKHPYAFWGSTDADIVLDCQPMIDYVEHVMWEANNDV